METWFDELHFRCEPTSTMFFSRKYSTNMVNIFTWLTKFDLKTRFDTGKRQLQNGLCHTLPNHRSSWFSYWLAFKSFCRNCTEKSQECPWKKQGNPKTFHEIDTEIFYPVRTKLWVSNSKYSYMLFLSFSDVFANLKFMKNMVACWWFRLCWW